MRIWEYLSLAMAIVCGMIALAAGGLATVAYTDYRFKSPTDDPDPLNATLVFGVTFVIFVVVSASLLRLQRLLARTREERISGEV